MFQFPFGTMHQLNLDWFLQQWQQLRQEWIDEEQNIEDSMQDVYDARDAAIQAKDDAVSAKNDAESAQAGVHADALMSEGFAVGEQNGTPVGAGSPYYQKNSKYYSTESGTYRYLSEAFARGTMGGTPVDPGDAGYEDNAKYYKDAADNDASATAADRIQTGLDAAATAADALTAEGHAVGEQNGTPVSSGSPYYQNNAKYYAQQTAQDKSDTDTLKDAANAAALRSEGWAVGEQNGTPVASGSPYYENNAEYYKDLAASVVLGADGAAAQAMIAGDEVSTTLTADYTAGSYIRVQGVLYRTTIDLETGDTLTVGTNCEVAVIGDDLQDVKEDVSHKADEIIDSATGNAVFIPDGAKSGIIKKWNVDFTRAISTITIGKHLADKNLFNNYTDYYAVSTSTGEVYSSAGYAVSDYIDISGVNNLYVFLNHLYSGGFNPHCAFYDANKDFISAYSYSNSQFTKTQITVPATAVYMRIDCVRPIITNNGFYVGESDGCYRYSYALGVTTASGWTAELVSGTIKDDNNTEYQMSAKFDMTLSPGKQYVNTSATIYDDSTIEYVADTKLYIDKKIAELQALVLENS